MANIIQQLKNANGDNIYPIAYAQGGMKMDLLWTNPSPTSSFSPQTVSLDLSEYNLVYAIFNISPEVAATSDSAWLLLIDDERPTIVLNPSYLLRYREVRATSTGVVFGSGLEIQSYGQDAVTKNDRVIPRLIYGIKMSYVVPTTVHGLQYVEV